MSLATQEEIKRIVERQLGKRDVKNDERLVEDLGAESADVANLVAAVGGCEKSCVNGLS